MSDPARGDRDRYKPTSDHLRAIEDAWEERTRRNRAAAHVRIAAALLPYEERERLWDVLAEIEGRKEQEVLPL